MGNLLETKNISKRFPGVIAISNVNLEIGECEIHGLIGANGAGKSTLLKILTAIYPYGTFEGEIIFDSKPIEIKNTKMAQEYGIKYVPQEINVLNNLSVAENIFVSALKEESKGGIVSFKKINKKAKELLEYYNINLDPRVPARSLSIGQKQMLMIARALTGNARLLILDEPTTSLSQKEVNILFDIVRGLKAKGLSIIFVTHKMSEILCLTDSVTILRDGKNISSYKRESYSGDQIINDMIGRKVSQMYPKREQNIGPEILKVQNISVSHPKILNRNLIENISFTLKKGEVLGIGGLVGAGRTELLETLFGRYKLNDGDIFVNGKKIILKNEKSALKHGIVLVTEDRKKDGLLFGSDIKWNLNINGLKAISNGVIISNKKLVSNAESLSKRLRVKSTSINTGVVTLSGGNQQKVVLGRALNINPQILLLDEPTKGIDVGSKNEIYDLINELTQKDVAVIIVSSELDELLGLCDRFLIMANGRVTAQLSKEEASEKSIMLAATQS